MHALWRGEGSFGSDEVAMHSIVNENLKGKDELYLSGVQTYPYSEMHQIEDCLGQQYSMRTTH